MISAIPLDMTDSLRLHHRKTKKSLTDSPPIVDEHMASIVMERSRPPSQPTTPRTKNVTAFL